MAERNVWRAIRDHLPDEWRVIHSLWHRTHERKLDAEADFLLIGPPGVLVIEAKGGDLERDDSGFWVFRRPSTGEILDRKSEGPFDQARGAMYGLRNHVMDMGEVDAWRRHVWGYGVVTPECTLRIPPNDPEIKDWLVLGDLRFPEGITDFVDGLVEHWRSSRIDKGYVDQVPLSPHVIERLVTLLRPQVSQVVGMGAAARRADQQIIKLTQEQKKSLKLLALSDRVVLRGGAGTGKTVLAKEQAREQSALGHRVLFLCFNRNLADVLRAQAEDDPELSDVLIYNYHQLVGVLLKTAGLSHEVPEDWGEFNEKAEDLIIEAIDTIDGWQPFDYLIIDEGQDLMAPEFLGVIDLLLEGGLERGRWTLCLDPTQTIFLEQFDQDEADNTLQLGVQANLTENCRNTRAIHSYVHGLGKLFPTDTSAHIEGPHPSLIYYASRSERRKELRRAVNRIVTDFREADVPESDIIILLARTGEFEEDLESERDRLIAPLVKFKPGEKPEEHQIAWSTVQSYKGLEAKAVVLVGLESLRDPLDRRLFYVGASRARTILTVLLPIQEEESVQLSMNDVLKLMTT